MAEKDLQRTRGAGLRRGVSVLVLAVVFAVQLMAAAIAEAGTPVTYQGGLMGTSVSTQDKPQSKLWRHDGSWWALMNGQVDNDVYIHRLAANHTWEQTAQEVDTRRSYGDVLADGDRLYVLSRRNGNGGTALIRFTYDAAAGGYQKSAGYPVTVITAATESATIAKDSAGVLWVAYTAPDSLGVPKVWVTHSTGTSDNTWLPPFELPVADTAVSADDIAAVVALDGKIGVMWSNQVSDNFRFVTHQDGAPPDQWGTLETALGGLDMADDHMNLKKAADGRLFAAVKTSKPGPLQPRLLLLVRETNGTWSSQVHSLRSEGMTRPIVLLDETHRRVFLFAATAEGTGAQTYYKTTSMDAPAFAPGEGAPFVSSPGTTLINATSTKQPVDTASGVVVLSGDRDGVRYYHGELPLTPETTIDSGPADPTSSTSASFGFSSDDPAASFECKLDGAAEFTACGSPQDYLDLAPGNHTFEVRAVDAAGVRDPSPASRSWTIDTSAPETTIDSGPADPTSSTSASFGFSSDDPAATFECKLDDAAEFSPCSSPKEYQDLSPGSHTLLVRATDAVGSTDPSPASHSWTVSPILFQDSSFAANSTASTLEIPKPTQVAVGDQMVATIAVRAGPGVTPPAGWFRVREDVNGNAVKLVTYRNRVGKNEPSSFTWTFSHAHAAAGGIVAYRGVRSVAPVDISGGQANARSTSLTAPSITTTVANARLIGLYATPVASSIEPPTGMIERGEASSTAGTRKMTVAVADAARGAAGPTGASIAVAGLAALNVGQHVALVPAAP